jgi:hypothetical protein
MSEIGNNISNLNEFYLNNDEPIEKKENEKVDFTIDSDDSDDSDEEIMIQNEIERLIYYNNNNNNTFDKHLNNNNDKENLNPNSSLSINNIHHSHSLPQLPNYSYSKKTLGNSIKINKKHQQINELMSLNSCNNFLSSNNLIKNDDTKKLKSNYYK